MGPKRRVPAVNASVAQLELDHLPAAMLRAKQSCAVHPTMQPVYTPITSTAAIDDLALFVNLMWPHAQ